jgi:hypothetical protein
LWRAGSGGPDGEGVVVAGADLAGSSSNNSTLFTAQWNGRHWKVTKLPGIYRRIVWGAGGGPTSLSCPTATNCVAVGGQSRNTAYALTWNGHSWRTTKAGSRRRLARTPWDRAERLLQERRVCSYGLVREPAGAGRCGVGRHHQSWR